MFAACPACSKRLYEYRDGRWTEQICWHCGHYSSNTPAFSAQPELFRNVVRKNGAFFMKKYAYYARCLT